MTVATFEFLSAVKRPGYLIATFGMPLFMAAYGAVVAVPAYIAEKGSRAPSVYGVVDEPGVLGLSGDLNAGKQSAIPEEMRQALEAAGQGQALERALAADNFVFRPYTSRDEAHAALAERRLKGYFVIPKEYMREGRLDVYTPDSFNVSGSDSRNALSDLLRDRTRHLAHRDVHRIAGRVWPVQDRVEVVQCQSEIDRVDVLQRGRQKPDVGAKVQERQDGSRASDGGAAKRRGTGCSCGGRAVRFRQGGAGGRD